MRLSFMIFFLCLFVITGCSHKADVIPPEDSGKAGPYSDLGSAPELANDTWLNSSAPLRLANLRGKVVLIDMWTFG